VGVDRPIDVRVGALGAQGDGIAGPLYVPFTVPGDLARVLPGAPRGEGRTATLIEVIEPGPHRTSPVCRHFGVCGGCALQHLDAVLYAGFKHDQVARALAHHGLGEVPVAAPMIVPRGARRRIRLTARRAGSRVLLGYLERGSHRLVDVAECPVAAPPIVGLLPPLRALVGELLGARDTLHATATATLTGVDLLLAGDRRPGLHQLQRLAAFAEAQDLARVSWETREGVEPVAVRRSAVVRFGGVEVALPPGAFLQAAVEAEAWMIDIARRATAGVGRIVDLFSGCGTFAAALAGQARVAAFEADAALVEAARAGLNRATGLRPVTVARRDLFREPLTPRELAPFGAAVIDPPRAGARAQSEMLAASAVPVLVAFSCNPATFARDARILVDGGYVLEQVTPIDQFLWSSHVELAAVFGRA
jgi:23S rRNA (uracil1939-C5)-methyltransferase